MMKLIFLLITLEKVLASGENAVGQSRVPFYSPTLIIIFSTLGFVSCVCEHKFGKPLK